MLVLLGLLTAFGPIGMDMYLPAMPELGVDLSASDPQLQLTLSLCMIGMGIGQAIGGPLSDRHGRRGLLVAGIAGFIVAVVGTALSPTIEVLLFTRLLTGVGGGLGVVMARSMVRDLYGGVEMSRAFAVIGMVFGVAPVVAPLLGAAVLLVTDWRGVFVLIAVVAFGLLLGAWRLGETLPAERRVEAPISHTFRTFADLLRDKSFIRPTMVITLAMVPLFLYLAMSSLVLQRHYGLTPQQYGWVFAGNALGIVVAGRVSMSLVGRISEARILQGAVLASLLACTSMVIGVVLADSLWPMLAGLLVVVTATGFIMPNATSLALAGQRDRAGSASSLMGLVQMVVCSSVPPLVALAGVTPLIFSVALLSGIALAAPAALMLRRA